MAKRQGALEDLVRNPDPAFWRGRRVLLTGHTGFKGAWMALWLERLGAKVHAIALPPDTSPNLFELAHIDKGCISHLRDLRDAAGIAELIGIARPQVVFHLAAQALVRRSVADPLGTYETNVLGTANLLNALRTNEDLQGAVIVTSDKVYANRGTRRPFSESDPLGGDDPYSASKAACELVAQSFSKSFFKASARIVTARGGNVIGGGDFAEDRIVPDCVRAALAGEPVVLRHPDATRPWQHVLDCLCGYLLYAEQIVSTPSIAPQSLNFGPELTDMTPVIDVATITMTLLGSPENIAIRRISGSVEKEQLAIDSSLARRTLHWKVRLVGEDAIRAAADWYVHWQNGNDMRQETAAEIERYESLSGRLE